MRGKTITVLGLAGQSVFMELDHFHRPGETAHCLSMYTEPGGKGCNQAVAARRLGAEVDFITALGDDSYGRVTLDFLRNEGIEVLAESIPGVQTAYACILTDREGENRVTVFRGAADCLSGEMVRRYRSRIRQSSLLLLNLEYPLEANLEAMALADEAGIPVIINPAPYREGSLDLLKRAWLITPNRQEAAAIAGTEQSEIPEKIASRLQEMGFSRLLITLGGDGALLMQEGQVKMLPSMKRKAVDTTGAGDCFNGVLALALCRGRTLEDSAAYAVKASGFSVEKRFVMNSLPYKGDLE